MHLKTFIENLKIPFIVSKCNVIMWKNKCQNTVRKEWNVLKQIITILCIQNSQSLLSYQNLTTSEKTPTTTEAFFICIPFLDKSATTKTTVYQKKQIIQGTAYYLYSWKKRRRYMIDGMGLSLPGDESLNNYYGTKISPASWYDTN